MDNKLLIGVGAIIVLVLALPVIGPMLHKKNAYDPTADAQKIAQMDQAVENYARANGQYPPSLHYLVPNYLPEVPLTTTRLQFQYDPQTGRITNPSAPKTPEDEKDAGRRGIRSGGGGGGGISPATDAMTGLSASQELNF